MTTPHASPSSNLRPVPSLAPQSRQRLVARLGDQAGFTLIEILVTVALTMIALAGLLSLNVAVTRGNAMASQTSEAVAIAKSIMEEIRTLPATQVSPSGAYSAPELRDGRNTSFVIGAEYTALTLLAGDPANSTYHVRVTVSWLENADKQPATASPNEILQFGPGGAAANGPGCDATAGCANFHSISLELIRSTRDGI